VEVHGLSRGSGSKHGDALINTSVGQRPIEIAREHLGSPALSAGNQVQYAHDPTP
jgi:hypothetical protein